MQQPAQSLPDNSEIYEKKLPVEPFRQTLAKHGLDLARLKTTTLQVNVGLLCNQSCRHCHLEAGPNREEVMDAENVAQVVAFAKKYHFVGSPPFPGYDNRGEFRVQDLDEILKRGVPAGASK